MKEKVWDSPNKMRFDSPHKTFNKQCSLITTGNQIGNVVFSNFVRPFSEVECNSVTFEPGHLQNYDLTKNIISNTLPQDIREEIRKLTHDNGGIAYNFHHWSGNKRIDDGIVLTTKDYKLVKVWYLAKSWYWRSRWAVDEAVKYITN